MMNRKEFQQYLQETIKDYLPESYADAKITFNEVVKNNDTHLTGMSIARPGEQVVPNIYIENFWNDYQKGKNINEIAGDIADIRIEYDDPSISPDMAQQLMHYDGVKDNFRFAFVILRKIRTDLPISCIQNIVIFPLPIT